VNEIAGLAQAKHMARRLWVPFADSQTESPDNYGALLAIARNLGVTYRRCPVRWAAYYASDEETGEKDSSQPIEPLWMPNRATSALGKVTAAAVAAGTLLGMGNGIEAGAASPITKLLPGFQSIENKPDGAAHGDSQVKRFAELARIWHDETEFLSSPIVVAEHAAYREIIAMGGTAIPLIMSEMEERPGQWFAALRAITGVDPVPVEVSGDVRAMTAVWLDWGKVHGYR